jgi:hypothetical protein
MDLTYPFKAARNKAALVGTCASLLLSHQAAAAVFDIDPDRSTITVSGNLAGFEVGEQAPGSLTSKLEGKVTVEVGADTIRFLEGELIRVQDNGTWEPLAGGEPGSAPGAFGGKAGNFLASAVAAGRDMELSLVSEVLDLTGSEFPADGLVFSFPTGGKAAFDYRVTGLLLSDAGRLQLEGYGTNVASVPATLTTEGTTQTITIPLDTTYRFALIDEETPDTEVSIAGQLVATRSMGETPTDFDGFTEAFFPGETNPDIIGPTANGDGDLLINFVEFAFGRDPTQPDPDFAPLSAQVQDANTLVLTFDRPTGLQGVGYPVFGGTALGQLDRLNLSESTEDLGDGMERVTLEVDLSDLPDSSQFFSLASEMLPYSPSREGVAADVSRHSAHIKVRAATIARTDVRGYAID